MTLVLTNPKKPLYGVGIGSPLAAGAAQLVVSRRETLKGRETPPVILNEVRSKVHRMRWMDDMALMVQEPLSPAATELVTEYLTWNFYGDKLILKQTPGTDVFGFLLDLKPGEALHRPRWGFLHRRLNWEKTQKDAKRPIDARAGVHGGQQYRSGKVERSIVTGSLYRLMDMSNDNEKLVQLQATRLILEYLNCGFNVQEVDCAIRKANRDTWLGLAEVRRVLSWSPAVRRQWVAVYDVLECARLDHADASSESNDYLTRLVRRPDE